MKVSLYGTRCPDRMNDENGECVGYCSYHKQGYRCDATSDKALANANRMEVCSACWHLPECVREEPFWDDAVMCNDCPEFELEDDGLWS